MATAVQSNSSVVLFSVVMVVVGAEDKLAESWTWMDGMKCSLELRRLKLHGIKRQKVPKIHGLKKHQKNHSLACKKSSRF